MAQSPGTSFIPKKTVQRIGTPVRRKRFYLITFLTSVLFFSSILVAGGTYFYKDYSQTLLIEQQDALAQEREKFSEASIASVRSLEERLVGANALLNQHVSASRILDVVETVTAQTIQFTEFELIREQGGRLALTLTGLSQSFNDLIFQKDVLTKSDLFAESVVSDVSYESATVAEEVDPAAPTDTEPQITFAVTLGLTTADVAYTVTPTIESVSLPEVVTGTLSASSSDDSAEAAPDSEGSATQPTP